MSDVDPRFRRNFVVAAILHVALIGGIILWESFFAERSQSALASVQLVTPADLLGELPKGEGQGRGAYKALAPTPPGADMIAGPNEAMSSSDESTAPQPKPAANEIVIPKNTATKKPIEPVKKPAATTTKSKAPAVTKATAKPKSSTVASGPSVDDIRRRLTKALETTGDGKNGTPYGDGKTAGGGNVTSGRIGSPTGSPNGIPGGIGQGSLFWEYYQHVHDEMYQAWEQPGDAVSKKLVATVFIRVLRDGTIADVSLKGSSGNKLMDDSALSAARKVQRLEPPPDALVKGDAANITVDFQVEG